jgi:hypothetical protein
MNRHLARWLSSAQRAASKLNFITWVAYLLFVIGLVAAALH